MTVSAWLALGLGVGNEGADLVGAWWAAENGVQPVEGFLFGGRELACHRSSRLGLVLGIGACAGDELPGGVEVAVVVQAGMQLVEAGVGAGVSHGRCSVHQ